ncbi:MAG: sialate O-acetylesterase [Planctomycetes bacterium]|nr:sialate O-acetylesterase [Planctomycetota bacterium]
MTSANDNKAPIKVACVGDSITFGSGIKDRKNKSYPAQLARMLGSKYTVNNFGVGGATLLKKGDKPYWELKRFQSAKKFGPNIVVIKLGTNDSKPQNWQHKSEFKANYLEFIGIFKNLESKPKVSICYPIPVFAESWGITEEIVKGEVIPLIKEIANEAKVEVIDCYDALKGKADLVPDNVHPNAGGATLIAESVAKHLGKSKSQE